MRWKSGLWGITFELTGPMRRDGLARVGKMYRVPQAGPRQPAVAGPVVQRGVRPQRGAEQFEAHYLTGLEELQGYRPKTAFPVVQ